MFTVRSSHSEVFCKKGVLRNFTKFTGKHLCQSLFCSKVAGQRSATLFKNRRWQRCFPENFVKFLRTPFYIEHLWWLLLMKKMKNVNNFRVLINICIFLPTSARLYLWKCKKLVFSSVNVVVFNDTFQKMIFLLTYSNFGVLFILPVFFCFLLFIFKIYLDQSNIFRWSAFILISCDLIREKWAPPWKLQYHFVCREDQFLKQQLPIVLQNSYN